MDTHQHRARWEQAHADFAYFAIIFTVINFHEDRSIKDVRGFLEADVMLRLVFCILIRIPCKVYRLYMIGQCSESGDGT
jgi:hypothetical protein